MGCCGGPVVGGVDVVVGAAGGTAASSTVDVVVGVGSIGVVAPAVSAGAGDAASDAATAAVAAVTVLAAGVFLLSSTGPSPSVPIFRRFLSAFPRWCSSSSVVR